ncbi:unnamed protein product, partial [Mesorhabditis spiculigera]
MVRSAHRPKDSSPRPYVIRESLPCLLDESTSISSADEALECSPGPSCSIWTRVRAEGTHFLEDIVEAFESPQKDHDMSADNTRLSAVQLRRDIRRCYAASHPFIQCAAALYDLLLWKNPLATLLLMLVFFYSLYRGWLASLLIALFWLQLSLNYLKSNKNIDIGLNFLPRKDIPMPKFDITGAQVIYEVAKVGQRLLSLAAGFLEKLEALLTWRDPEVTKIFYGLLVYWLAWSLAFTTGTCIGWCVAALGVRIFLTTFLFKKFPLLRYRLDTYGYFYRNLPLKQKSLRPAISEHKSIPKIFTESPSAAGSLHSLQSRLHTPRRSICNGEIFQSKMGSNFDLNQLSTVNVLEPGLRKKSSISPMPSPQAPSKPVIFHASSEDAGLSSLEDDDSLSNGSDPMLDNVIAFRSCVLNDKEKRFPKGISQGILYLTDRALVFKQKGKAEHPAPLLVVEDIKSVRKISILRTLSLLAGTRKSIEIVVSGRSKPVQFIGVAKRDDFVMRLEVVCRTRNSSTIFHDE